MKEGKKKRRMGDLLIILKANEGGGKRPWQVWGSFFNPTTAKKKKYESLSILYVAKV